MVAIGDRMTEISTDRKIGVFAPSGYGKTYLIKNLLSSINPSTKIIIYDTDYEDSKYKYSEIGKHVIVFKPDYKYGKKLSYLNDFLENIRGKYTNAIIFVDDLDVFFDEASSMSFEASQLKDIASTGRHQRIGIIYASKQMTYIPTKLMGNTNLFYIGKFTTTRDVDKLKNWVSSDEINSLNPSEHEFWEFDGFTSSKRKVNV